MGKKELALAYRCLIGLLASWLCIIPGLAASPVNKKFAEIDTFVESKMAKDHIPGVSLVVAQGDEIVYRHGYGIAGTDRPMTTYTPMFIS
jgi:CubicO group peptidase (beta-lactamase class C family)